MTLAASLKEHWLWDELRLCRYWLAVFKSQKRDATLHLLPAASVPMHWLLFLLRFFLNRHDHEDQNSVRLAARIDGGLLQVRRPTLLEENSGRNLHSFGLAIWRWFCGLSPQDKPHGTKRFIAPNEIPIRIAFELLYCVALSTLFV